MKKIGILIYGSIFLASVLAGCDNDNAVRSIDPLFPKGDQVPAENFTGSAWNKVLVTDDTIYQAVIGNVYFEPRARTNWHSHPGGQILVIVDGEGFHQIRGESKQHLKKGDVVKCPPNVLHWHGAALEKGMSQMYIVPNTEKGIVNWMEAVTDEQYNSN
jgi:quercetin dioxygenase-like cupin family protein